MDDKKASRLLEWEAPDGTVKLLILVTDESKSPSDIDHRHLELCVYDSKENKWKTDERISLVSEILEYGFSEKLID